MMMRIFKRLGFVEEKEFILNIGKDEFVRKFKTEVRDGSPSLWFKNPFEAFKSYDETYIGRLSNSNFEIRNLLSFGTSYQAMSKMKGTIRGSHEKTIVNVTFLTGQIFMPMLLFLPVLYLIIFLVIIMSSLQEGESSLLAILPFFLVHAGFMFGIFWFLLRRSHRSMKKQFEKDLVYISHK